MIAPAQLRRPGQGGTKCQPCATLRESNLEAADNIILHEPDNKDDVYKEIIRKEGRWKPLVRSKNGVVDTMVDHKSKGKGAPTCSNPGQIEHALDHLDGLGLARRYRAKGNERLG